MAKYQERLYWHVRRMVIEHEDANDVIQNCLVKVFRSIGRFEQKSQLYTWLYRIATNEAITFLKKKKRRSSHGLDDPESQVVNKLEADPWFDGDRAEMLLQKALAELPDKQKQVFLLRYYEEMPYQQMSEVLDTSVGALKASYHHAVKKVEQVLLSSMDSTE
ncbi:MAG: RNA polymerase sigma factor [Bacteroidetes bacterium]|nr:RNA polymerase sigma factor [Bacteroidota bacterium]